MIYLCDIDGTIADISHRLHFIKQEPPDWKAFFAACGDDKPITEVIEVIRCLSAWRSHHRPKGVHIHPPHHVVMITGRSDEIRERTEHWLRRNGVPFSELLMRKAGDHREDSIVKSELLDELLTRHDRGHILGVFDDRQQVVDMYRARGLRVFQVDKGNF